jgi:hypothetical protein
MKRCSIGLWALAVILLPWAGAHADVQFELGTATLNLHSTDPGLVMEWQIDPNVLGHSFSLANVGDFDRFNLAFVWTDETAINPDDLIAYDDAVASIEFVLPPGAGTPTVPGHTVGTSELWGIIQGWELVWNGPVNVPFSNGGVFRLTLDNISFASIFGPDGQLFDNCTSVRVCLPATVELVKAPVVPLPPAAGLGFLGLALTGIARRYRRARK